MIKKIISMIVVFSICFSNSYIFNAVYANEQNLDSYKDTTEAGAILDSDYEITTMDENGNIQPLSKTEADMPKENNVEVRNFNSVTPRINNSSVAVVNFRTKSSSIYNTEYTEVGTNRAGYTNGYYAADGAFLGYDNESNPTKVKFMQAGVIGWVNASEVQVLDYTSSAVNTLSKYYVKNGRLYHGISTNLANSNYSSSLDCGPKPSYLKEGVDYYSYDGHYFYEGSVYSTYATMLNDYRNNNRTHAVNSNSPYYNYYEYLSHRSVTTYTASQLNAAINEFVPSSETANKRTSKLRNTAEAFIENQNKYGTNALLMIGVAANESAWGCSNIAANKNNLFGHAAYDSDPNGSANGYSSVEYSIYYHSSQFISKGYLDPVTDGRYFGANLGDKANGINVKYASDPYWGEKAAAICWKIDNYLGSKDYNKYTIGIKDTINSNHSVVSIKSNTSSSSSTLYSTYPKSKTTSLKNQAPASYPFIILDNGGNSSYYKIQSDGAVNSTRTGIVNTPSQAEYDFDKDYGYIPTSSVTIINDGYDSSTSNSQNSENVAGQPSGKNPGEPTISYAANSQGVGWLEMVTEPNTAGTTGRSLDLYQIKISLTDTVKSAKLSGKVYSNGQWLNYSKITNTTEIGNANIGMQLVNFTLENQAGYRLQYRVHSADIGWQDWVNQGNNAGTLGKNIQAIDFRLIKDNYVIVNEPSIYYQAHSSNIGWIDYVGDSEIAGTVGQSLGLEAFRIGIDNIDEYELNVKTYDSKNGWVSYNNVDGEDIVGTTGQVLSLQAINATLTNKNGYKLQYRTYLSEIGWSNWTNQGEISGVTSGNNQIEAIMFRIIQDLSISSVVLNKQDLTIGIKESETLIATIYPINTTDNKNLIWSSSDPNVATVDQNGKVTGKSAGTATITVTTTNGKQATCQVTVLKASVSYQTHIENDGWQDVKSDGKTSGTTGEAKRLEGIKIKLDDYNTNHGNEIEYQVHVADYGWLDWTSNGQLAGRDKFDKQLEAIKIRLKGEIAEEYDVYYRVHAEEFGWLDWAKNGECAGTAGYAYQLEAIEIMLVEKGNTVSGSTENPYIQKNYISYRSHVEDYGWLQKVYDGAIAGTEGKNKQLEAVEIKLENPQCEGSIKYQSHVADYGWLGWSQDGTTSGTVGRNKQLEAIKIELTGEMALKYDVYYQVHVADYGWLGWAKNGESAGTEGLNKQAEAIKIILVKKGDKAPESNSNAFIKR